jgi:hypothetical protein
LAAFSRTRCGLFYRVLDHSARVFFGAKFRARAVIRSCGKFSRANNFRSSARAVIRSRAKFFSSQPANRVV